MTFLLDEPIDFAPLFTVVAWRDDGLHASRIDGLGEHIAVVTLVADEGLGALRGQLQPGVGLADIAGLPAGQHEVQ
jgi:hypothetical protein